MEKPYLVMVDGKLWDRKLTAAGARKVIKFLRAKGLNAVLAHGYIAGAREIMGEA